MGLGPQRGQGPRAAEVAARDDGGPEDGEPGNDGAEEGLRPKVDDTLSKMFLRAARTLLDGEGLRRASARAEDKVILDAVRAHSHTHVRAATSSWRLMGDTAGGDHDQVFEVCRGDARNTVITFHESFEVIKNGAVNGQTINDSAQGWKKKHVSHEDAQAVPASWPGVYSSEALPCSGGVLVQPQARFAGHVASPLGASAH